MKKLVVALCAVLLSTMAAKAEFIWSWWAGAPEAPVSQNVSGCVLGFASEVKSIKGAQVSAIYSIADEVRNGCQVAFVTKARKAALQFGLVCINDEGFLPWFIFFNFSKGCYGEVK